MFLVKIAKRKIEQNRSIRHVVEKKIKTGYVNEEHTDIFRNGTSRCYILKIPKCIFVFYQKRNQKDILFNSVAVGTKEAIFPIMKNSDINMLILPKNLFS